MRVFETKVVTKILGTNMNDIWNLEVTQRETSVHTGLSVGRACSKSGRKKENHSRDICNIISTFVVRKN